MTMINRRQPKIMAAAFLLPLALAACGGQTEGEGEATESELGDIDVLEGSISDDMITLDRFGENPPPAEGEAGETEESEAEAANNDDDAG
ncbi:MAG: hypothetical protein AAFX04_12290 [Pseudomonadota bacterium]